MAFLRRLKAWGAVEKNGRRLHLINSSIILGFAVGFGLLDMLLSRLQHGNLAPVQRVACALRDVGPRLSLYIGLDCVNAGLRKR